jgi:putative addiction module component (TIGR02574 family)
MGNAVAAILQLPLADRIEAVKAIWESIGDVSAPLSEAQRGELDARLDAYDRDPQGGESWETVRERVCRAR